MASSEPNRAGTAQTHLSLRVFGLSLSGFLAISYLLCIAGYLFLPKLPVQHSSLALVLPGFELLSWRTFLLGLVESALWGWYVAIVFVPLYNYFARGR